MKKFKTMMTVVLVALMACVMVSCGSDDNDDNANLYRLATSLNISEPGNMTREECEALIMRSNTQSVGRYDSDDASIIGTHAAADILAAALEEQKDEFGEAVMTYTLKNTRERDGSQVITYYVSFNKGEINVYNNKN